tara:strand:- start:612 stop:755 length:144 start_codon:yes stop_codon:yes gene_type:complete
MKVSLITSLLLVAVEVVAIVVVVVEQEVTVLVGIVKPVEVVVVQKRL